MTLVLVSVIKKIQTLKKALMALGVPFLFTPTACKFHPSCSEYAIEAITAHGPIKGGLKGIWRILRCNPWSRGGVDMV